MVELSRSSFLEAALLETEGMREFCRLVGVTASSVVDRVTGMQIHKINKACIITVQYRELKKSSINYSCQVSGGGANKQLTSV